MTDCSAYRESMKSLRRPFAPKACGAVLQGGWFYTHFEKNGAAVSSTASFSGVPNCSDVPRAKVPIDRAADVETLGFRCCVRVG